MKAVTRRIGMKRNRKLPPGFLYMMRAENEHRKHPAYRKKQYI
ncbi:MAG: hypothetical protein PHW75_03060 [Patescibacteria group bacterium]|nr:hypothetical protein [Patescibacteria group bacterium]